MTVKRSHLQDADAADLLGTTPATLRKSRVTGSLWGLPTPVFYKFGRRVCYRTEDLERWLLEKGTACTSNAQARLVTNK